MDAVEYKLTPMEYVKKYRLVFFVLLIGVLFMLMPEKKQTVQEVPSQTIPEKQDLETDLAQILSKIDGAGKTEVLLTESAGEQTYYQVNEDISSSDHGKDQRTDTVLVTNSSREETGLVRRTDPPIYRGAIILCQGAANAQVRLSIVEAVANATGLSTDKITVLKMK